MTIGKFLVGIALLISGYIISVFLKFDISEISKTMTVGIIGGIGATALIFVITKLWKEVFVPWYENLIYKDISINGKWEGALKIDTDKYQEKIIIKQSAFQVNGTITEVNGTKPGKIFTFNGIIKNLNLVCTYESQDKTSLDRGCFSLRLENDGNCLKGYSLFYHDPDNSIKTGGYIWNRIKQ